MKNGMRRLCRLNDSRAVWMLKGVRCTGNCVCVLSDAPEWPKWVRLTVKCKWRWMKREEKPSSFPCRCMGVTFCIQKGAEMLEKFSRLGTSFPHSALGPSRAVGLILQPSSQQLCGTTGNLQGTAVWCLALLQLLQTLILPSSDSLLAVFHLPALLFSFYYPFLLSCLSPVFSCHSISL